MDVLVPIDGSSCSYRALEYGADFAERYEAALDVVYITSADTRSPADIFEEAEVILDEFAIEAETEVVSDPSWSDPRYGNQIGKDILKLVENREYDHVIMGHSGTGAVERVFLGSASQTVVKATTVPVTIIP